MPDLSRARSHKRRFRYTAAPEPKIVLEPKEKKGPLGETLQPGKVFFQFNPRSNRDWLWDFYRARFGSGVDLASQVLKDSSFPGYEPDTIVFDSVERLTPGAEAETGMSSAGEHQNHEGAVGARKDVPGGGAGE